MLPKNTEIYFIQPRRNFKRISMLTTLLVSLTLILPLATKAATDCDKVGQITRKECEALIMLYEWTNGEYWYDSPRNNWNVTNEPCNWKGVVCDSGHVTEIHRNRQGLVGKLPHFGSLSHLREFDIGSCRWEHGNYHDNTHIKGTVSGARFPKSLQKLDLSCTSLEGTIPDFRSLTRLQDLNLSHNQLRGPIPTPTSHFPTSLLILDLAANPVLERGVIPNFDDFRNLQELDLSSTNRIGQIEVSSFPTSLRVLDLSNNQLQETIPNFRPLTNLQNLSLSNNQLRGAIPNPISYFPTSLRVLYLSSNSGLESGDIPDFSKFKQLRTLGLSATNRIGPIDVSYFPTSLRDLDLSRNSRLEDVIPDFQDLDHLISLDLAYTQRTGSVQGSLFPNSLQRLWLDGNQLTGIESDFSQLSNLYYLHLDNNRFSGSLSGDPFPTSLQRLYLHGNQLKKVDFGQLINLYYLDLSQNQFSGSLSGLPFPTSLKELYLSNNQLTEVNNDFKRLNNLSYLDLSDNQLTGALFGSNLPTSLVKLYLNDNQLTGVTAFRKLTHLWYLNLTRNQINGALLGSAFPTSLRELYLSDNQLTGIANNLSKLNNLQHLNVSQNQLSGSLSRASLPTSLQVLYLNNNQLEGKLPKISHLTQLQHLDLSENQLKDILPDFSLLTNLRTLNLSHNQFSGAIPSSLTKLTNLNQVNGLDLGYNSLTTFDVKVLKFLEAPGSKDPDWSYTQGAQLQCPNGGTVTIQPEVVNFGTELINSHTSATVSMRSQDCDNLKIQTVKLGGSDISEFQVTTPSCDSGGEQGHRYSFCQFTIDFLPTSAGTKEGIVVNLTFTIPNMPIFSIPVEATAVESGEPKIEVSFDSYDFGQVYLDNLSELQLLTVKNTGEINLKFDEIKLTGASDFKTYFHNCSTEEFLPPSAECFINTQFFPTSSSGVKNAQLGITSNATKDSLRITLVGIALEPEMCSKDNNITIASVNSGSWDSPATWTENRTPWEDDVVQINQGHLVTGISYAAVQTLCIEEGGTLLSADNQGTPLTIQADDYIENKGRITGQNGANEQETTTSCTTDYWSAVGKPSCAQPGASVYLSVGDWSTTRLRNEGTIVAGRGGDGKQYGAYGGIIGIYGGGLTNTAINGKGGMILSGRGGDITGTFTGQAGKGGDLSMLAKNYLHHNDVTIFAGDGGNCNPDATEPQWGGDGGDIIFNAPFSVNLNGIFKAGTGGIHCQPPENNGKDGQFNSDPGIISLSGANTKISGGDIAIYGGKDWVLDLTNLNGFKGTIITATGNVTLAVGGGEKSAINLRGSKGVIIQAAGQVNLFSDRIFLDDNVELSDIIKAQKIVVGPSQILRDVSLGGSGKWVGKPGATLPIRLRLSNNSPETDSYYLEVKDLAGWNLGELSSPVEIDGLDHVELSLNVQLPATDGEMNLVEVTAISQADPKVKATAEIQIVVAKTDAESIQVTEEVPVEVTEEHPIASSTTDESNPSEIVQEDTTTSPITTEIPAGTVPDDMTSLAQDNTSSSATNEQLPLVSKENSILPVESETDNTIPEETNITPTTSEIDNTTPPEVSAIATTVVTEPLSPIPNCPPTGVIDWLCDNHGQVMTDATLTINGNIAGGELAGIISSQGIISNITVQPRAEVHGGKLTGYIHNQGLLADFNFVGAFITDGILSGTITNHSQVGGVFKDVHLAANTQVSGGYLQGEILGDAHDPAHLEKLTVKAGSHLSNVILGADIKLAKGVTFQNVQLAAPLFFTEGNLQGDVIVTNVNFTNKLIFQDVHLAAHSRLTGVRLQGNILGDINAPALLEHVEIQADSYLSGVILGNGVKLAESVIFGDNVQLASSNSIESSSLPFLGARAIDRQGTIINTVAVLTGGISVNENPFDTRVITTLSDTVNISGQINPDPRHLGQEAAIVVSITYQSVENGKPIYLMLDANGQILPWDGDHTQLKPYQQVVLTVIQPVMFYQGSLDVPGIFNISFGYRLENGTLVQNTQPIEITVVK